MMTICCLQAQALPDDEAPACVHLIPAGELRTHDNRGQFKVKPAAKLILNPMTSGDRLPIDENHATDLAALNRMPAPARGWIVELAPHSEGIWGRVEFTEEGRHLVASKAHQGIFPFLITGEATMSSSPCAGFAGQPAQSARPSHPHQENDMDLLAQLASPSAKKRPLDILCVLQGIVDAENPCLSGSINTSLSSFRFGSTY
ncbi:MAG: phage protease, partial [Devosia sp.]